MKIKFKMITAFCAALSLISLKMGAQLSGAYTINQQILTSATNFTSFTAFAAAITASGVSTPVTINVVTGTGPYTEQVNFSQFTGSSNVNTVTVNGNGNTLTFTSTNSGAPHTLMLSGADYMFFNNLNVVGGGTYAMVCHLYGGSDNNNFFNCTFSAPLNGSSTTQCPFSLSGSATIVASAGNSGSNNTVQSCTMTSGYYNTVLYGNSTSPFNTGNKVINCYARDFYLYGVFNVYCQGTTIKGNTVDRLTRTTLNSCYGVFLSTGSANCLVEGNRIQKLFDGNILYTGTAYCLYINSTSGSLGNENVVRNNVVSDIRSAGTIYGGYLPSPSYCNFFHNTISLDDITTTTGSTTYGIYFGASPANNVYIRNNIVTIRRGGSGTKYCLIYYASTGLVSNNNVLYINSLAGTNAIGYYNALYTTLAQWKTANGWDQLSASADPLFNNPALLDYSPTLASINNIGQPLGVLTDVNGLSRNLPAPDAGAYEFFNTPCSSTPGANNVVVPSYVVCPSALSFLTLANTYTVNGLNYQWGYSTGSPLGPYTAISGGTLASLVTTTLSTSTWYTATVSCQGNGSPIITTAAQVSVATTVTNSVPYFEGFEGILNNNDLPNCSWLVNNPNAQTRTSSNTNNQIPNTGNKFASVYGYNLSGTNYYYTNGIQLNAGITYSASLFYTTEYYGYTNFTEISINLGTSQSTTGLVQVALQPTPVTPVYKQLANTFTVGTSGIYYVAVKVVSQAGSYANYLSWDDLSITAPCQINAPNLSLTGTTTSSVICAGQPVNFTASGATTYTWSTGVNTPTISDFPTVNTTYVVAGTNGLSGCSGSLSKYIVVKPSPQLSIFVFNPTVCEGSPVTLAATGAASYTWGVTGSNGSIFNAAPPTGNTTYTVVGSNAVGCTGMATQMITVNPAPNVSASNVPSSSCVGDNIVLTGSGAQTYKWLSDNLYTMGTSITIPSPNASTTYTVIGTDANGCSKTVYVNQLVSICTSIKSPNAGIKGLSVYPNPSAGLFTIELFNGLSKTIEVTDVTGRLIFTANTSEDRLDVNITHLSNGVYSLKVKSNNAVEVLKVVKQ